MATALEKIIDWAATLPDWESDAVRRLLTKNSVGDADKKEIIGMLKGQHGLADTSNPPPPPLPIKHGDVSGAQTANGTVVLKEIKEISNVNALKDGASIPFGHQGLTILYGENATGKSGYARVLKRACRARDADEVIHPNIYAGTAAAPPSAVFHLQVNGADQEVSWHQGAQPSEILSSVSVFDARCARVIVDQDNAVQYLPFGAQVFEDLVGLLNDIRSTLQIEKPVLQKPNWPDIPAGTAAGKLLDQLNAETDLQTIDQWTEEDEKKLLEVGKRLSQAEADDPTKSGRRLRNLAARLRQLAAKLSDLGSGVSVTVEASMRKILTSFAGAKQALEAAPQAVITSEPLPGVGGAAWQVLYRGARDFSLQDAYPGKDFPYTDQDARCVLCMQPLSEQAKDRLVRFRDYMEQTTKKAVEDFARQFDEARQKVPVDGPQTLQTFKDALDELASRGSAGAQAVPTFVASVTGRASALVTIAPGGNLMSIPALAANPAAEILSVASAMETEAAAVEKTAELAILSGLRASNGELEARKALLSRRTTLVQYVQNLKVAARYDQCIAETDFRHVTTTGKRIIAEALTPELQKSLKRELQDLGVSASHLPLKLQPVASHGETSHRLEIKAQRPIKVNLTDILSEGEERVVAIAGFLAELDAAGHRSPIVFDDPVSSLDDKFRLKIAHRLIAEAAKRQVIVFTHDVSFLMDLKSCQESFGLDSFGERFSGVAITVQTVERKGNVTGQLTDDLPWCAAKVGARLNQVRQNLAQIKTLHEQDPVAYNRAAAAIYGLLRETWEAFVEQTLFAGVVSRHEGHVKTRTLKEVTVRTSDCVAVHAGMTKASAWMTGHDKPKPLNVNRPDPSEIRKDIEALQAIENSFKERRKRAEKDFAAAFAPPVTAKGASVAPDVPPTQSLA